jgi:hypothetical protein
MSYFRFTLFFFWLSVLTPLPADDSVFGHTTMGEAALIGIMYDLKQDPSRHPTTENSNTYFDVVTEFLKKGWDEDVLNRYYRVSNPVYTTQIFVPNMSADSAPKAFGAEKTVQPSNWIIHYKGQVSPPSAGTYRFWGTADDLIAVAVNGKTELVYYLTIPKGVPGVWEETDPEGQVAADSNLRPGDWFTVEANGTIDLDVIIGERPGGYFNAFLMIEKKGETYVGGPNAPVLPIFQVAPFATPVQPGEPKFSKGAPWTCLQ